MLKKMEEKSKNTNEFLKMNQIMKNEKSMKDMS